MPPLPLPSLMLLLLCRFGGCYCPGRRWSSSARAAALPLPPRARPANATRHLGSFKHFREDQCSSRHTESRCNSKSIQHSSCTQGMMACQPTLAAERSIPAPQPARTCGALGRRTMT